MQLYRYSFGSSPSNRTSHDVSYVLLIEPLSVSHSTGAGDRWCPKLRFFTPPHHAQNGATVEAAGEVKHASNTLIESISFTIMTMAISMLNCHLAMKRLSIKMNMSDIMPMK